LTAKLARLADLETRFQGTLEAEKLEAMAEFAAGAGHEINNPLTVIAGRAQLLLREEEDPERRRGLASISAQAMRVHEMIADMMLFARPPKPASEIIDLVELVDQLIEEVSPQAARQDITLRRTGQAGPVEVEADATQLSVALRAMCQNSIEAIGRQGQIEIGLCRRGGEVEIRIADDGPGIPPEERRHLFDPFYSARQAGRGLGLGLSKCWRIVTNHAGRIEVESRPEHGTVFTITLPQRQG
jgi:signal transduction histidine kinase